MILVAPNYSTIVSGISSGAYMTCTNSTSSQECYEMTVSMVIDAYGQWRNSRNKQDIKNEISNLLVTRPGLDEEEIATALRLDINVAIDIVSEMLENGILR